MAETKTKLTKASVKDFIAAVENDARRADAEVLLKLFAKVSGWKAQMFGPTIVGFGKYVYTYDTGHSGEAPMLGFSPRSANLVIYGGSYPEQIGPILKRLGKHKASKACIYINKLADVDTAVLETLLKDGLNNMKKVAKEKGWPVSGT